MTNQISPVLQNNLLQLSTYVHQDERAFEERKSDIEDISKAILKTINAENPNVPTGAKLYLQKIAESIIDKNWGKIPKPEVMQNDLAMLRNAADSLKNAIPNAPIDISELMRVMISFKAKNVLSMIELSILDSKQSFELQKAQFAKIDESNKFQLGAELAQHGVAALASGAQIGVGFRSIAKNSNIFQQTTENISAGTAVGRKKGVLEDMKESYNKKLSENQENIKKFNKAEIDKSSSQSQLDEIKRKLDEFSAESPKSKREIECKEDELRNDESAFSKKSAELEKATSNARVRDDINRAAINLTKSILDGCFSSIKYIANERKLDADKLDAAKNIAEKSSATFRDASKSASDDMRTLIQTLSSIEQSLSSAMSNALRL